MSLDTGSPVSLDPGLGSECAFAQRLLRAFASGQTCLVLGCGFGPEPSPAGDQLCLEPGI